MAWPPYHGSRRQVMERLGVTGPHWSVPLPSRRAARRGGGLRLARRDQDMVSLLDAVARAARSGAGLREALGAARPAAGVHGDELGHLLGSLNRGRGLAEALAEWRRRCPGEDVTLASAALALGVSSGASLARAVDGAAATMRERVALRSEVRVHAAQARSSAVVVGTAPVGFTALSATADPAVGAFLFGSPGGWFCLTVGLSLAAAGIVWMQWLVTRAGTGQWRG